MAGDGKSTTVLGLVAASVILVLTMTVIPSMPASTDCHSSQARSTISFAGTIEPLLNTSCAIASCHVANGPPPHELILTAGESYGNLVDVPSYEASMKRVDPGDPEASYLIHKLRGTHKEVGGEGERMPFDLDPLTEREVAAIVTWIRDCSPNN